MADAAQVPMSTKLFYSLGASGESIKNAAFGFLLIYYNQVLGLSGTMAGYALAIALIFDAVIDPGIGSWSDGMKTRWGRRHPLMAVAILPFCLLVFGLFWPPLGLGQIALFLWLTVFTVGTRAAMALFHVPYLSLGAELTQQYRERTQIVSMRTGVALLSGTAITLVIWGVVFKTAPGATTGQLVRDNYFALALMCAVAIGVFTILSTAGTVAAVPHLAGSNQAPRKFGLRRVYHDIFVALRNPSFRALFIGTVIYFVYGGFQGQMAVHLQTFFWKLTTQAIQFLVAAGLLGAVAGLFFVPWFNGRFDKKWTVVIGVLAAAVLSTGPVVLRLFDLMPTDLTLLQWTLGGLGFLNAFIGVQATVSVGSMMGDIADEHELTEGSRQEGIFFGSYAFSQKCTTGLSTIVAGSAIDWIGLKAHADPHSIAPGIITNFGIAYSAVALLLLLSTWVFLPYRLDRARHSEILEGLAMRKSGAEAAALRAAAAAD